MHIRELDQRAELNQFRQCVIELQDYERRLVSRMPLGADIVDAYIPEMLKRCDECPGKVLVTSELNR